MFIFIVPLGGTGYGIPKTWEDLFFTAFTFIFLGVGLSLLFETFHSKVYFDEKGLRKQYVWTKDHSMSWNDIEKLDNSIWLDLLNIKSFNGKKIKVSDFMDGYQGLEKEIKLRRPDLVEVYGIDEFEQDFK